MAITQDCILVGVDGSEQCRHAIAWAADEARRTDRPLHLIHAVNYLQNDDIDNLELRKALSHDAQTVLSEAAAAVPDDVRPRCETSWRYGAAPTLLEALSAEVALVAVGSHGHSGLTAKLLGSVSQHLVRHAACPVVVARRCAVSAQRVIVGLDLASPEPAMTTAFSIAAARGLSVQVVHTWKMPITTDVTMASVYLPTEEVSLAEQQDTADVVASWAAQYPDVPIDLKIVEGDPTETLLTCATDSDLVVVGPHEKTSFLNFQFGSTSAAVAAHAPCCVLIARYRAGDPH